MNHDFINMPSREELIQKTKDHIDKICAEKDTTSAIVFSLGEDYRPSFSVVKKQDKGQLLASVDKLYKDIDECISQIVYARLNREPITEGRALFKMESLMVATQQELSYLHDLLKLG